MAKTWRVQLWWGDGWSYGTVFSTYSQAQMFASVQRQAGWTVQITEG